MPYEDRIVCFVDVLGFSALVSNTLGENGEPVQERVDALSDALVMIREVLDVDQEQDIESTLVTQFSDSFVISFRSSTNSGVFWGLLSILWVQVRLAQRGILCRGGIARGAVFHTPELLFGPAMIAAYTLESKAALYPRVILSPDIVEVGAEAHALHHDPGMEADSIKSFLALDGDGMYYIDYITSGYSELDDPEYEYSGYLAQLIELVRGGISSDDPSVRVKFQWLRTKLKPHVDAILNDLPNLELEPEMVDAYQSLPDLP